MVRKREGPLGKDNVVRKAPLGKDNIVLGYPFIRIMCGRYTDKQNAVRGGIFW